MSLFRKLQGLNTFWATLFAVCVCLASSAALYAQDTPEEGAQVSEESQKEMISSGQYALSVLVGSVVGFGAGHQINGAPQRGRIYRRVDAVGLSVMGAGFYLFVSDLDRNTETSFRPSLALTAGGLFIVSVSRIVQVADLLIEPLGSRRVVSKAGTHGPALALLPVIDSKRTGLQLSGRF